MSQVDVVNQLLATESQQVAPQWQSLVASSNVYGPSNPQTTLDDNQVIHLVLQTGGDQSVVNYYAVDSQAHTYGPVTLTPPGSYQPSILWANGLYVCFETLTNSVMNVGYLTLTPTYQTVNLGNSSYVTVTDVQVSTINWVTNSTTQSYTNPTLSLNDGRVTLTYQYTDYYGTHVLTQTL